MEQRIYERTAPKRIMTVLMGVFAGIALLLAGTGLYAVMAYAVSQRSHEIGIRLALGAQGGDVLRMVVRQGMKLTLIGVFLGVSGALALTRSLKALLFGVNATDPLTFAGAALLLVIVALVACWIPARRATKVDPMVVLKFE
jgi:putative ABC transport system permease protein